MGVSVEVDSTTGVDVEQFTAFDLVDHTADGLDHRLIAAFGDVGDAFDDPHGALTPGKGRFEVGGRIGRGWG